MFNVETEDHWIPLADLMTGLMLIFLLISVSYMLIAKKNISSLQLPKTIKSISQPNVATIQVQLFGALNKEFESNLKQWNATIDPQDLSFKFENSKVLFKTGDPTVNKNFQGILKDFIPRYLHILNQPNFKNRIGGVRIDGYTSSIWKNASNQEEAYFLNMKLSQERTTNVLKVLYSLCTNDSCREYLTSNVTANGYASSHVILNDDGSENNQKSQRVEFKIILTSKMSNAN